MRNNIKMTFNGFVFCAVLFAMFVTVSCGGGGGGGGGNQDADDQTQALNWNAGNWNDVNWK